jgi:hypothetical protein
MTGSADDSGPGLFLDFLADLDEGLFWGSLDAGFGGEYVAADLAALLFRGAMLILGLSRVDVTSGMMMG